MQERCKILKQLSRLNEQKRAMECKEVVEQISYQKCELNILETRQEKNLVPEAEYSPSFSMCDKDLHNAFQDHALKLRKASRRKQSENQDPCLLRGVYFKNMKWQAAIKVDKKQIHLGTVASMEEAAHLYDRAAYLCGRVPNFELSEEEKQELQGLQWEDFLQITKEAIANKKKQKRVESCVRRRRPSELLEDGRTDLPQSYDKLTSLYDNQVAPFQQLESFDESSDGYQHTSTSDETTSLLYQAATLTSLQQAHSLCTSTYERSAAFTLMQQQQQQQQQAQNFESFHQTTPFFSSESYFPPPLHQHTAYAGNGAVP